MTFHCPDEMTLSVLSEKLPLNNVNVLASINNHKVLSHAWHSGREIPGLVRVDSVSINYLSDALVPAFRNARMFLCSSGVMLALTRMCIITIFVYAWLSLL